MIATILKDNTLEIKAETELEVFALKMWADRNIKDYKGKDSLILNMNLEVKE